MTYLPCDLMTKVDMASMAFGLECRQPFLDHRVVELAARMPVGEKFRWGRGKRILREAFADLLPPPIRRRKKMGFGVPLDHWFRHEMRDFAQQVLFGSGRRNREGSSGRRRCGSCSTNMSPASPTTVSGYGRCWYWSCGKGSGCGNRLGVREFIAALVLPRSGFFNVLWQRLLESRLQAAYDPATEVGRVELPETEMAAPVGCGD